jgi:hypothetical protein
VINLQQVSSGNGMITSDMPDGSAYAVLFENIGKLIGMLVMSLAMLIKYAARKYNEKNKA